MTLKRIVLSVLTLLVVWVMGSSLIKSLGEPQVGNQLQLYQTDLLVQASEWDGSGLPENEVTQFRKAVFGEDAFTAAIEQYREVRKDAATGLARLRQQLENTPESEENSNLATMAIARSQQLLIDQIDLRLGFVQLQQQQENKALSTWESLAQRPGPNANVATTLIDLWQTPPAVPSNAATVINSQLRGWFRYTALDRLYTLEEKTEQRDQLEQSEVAIAEKTLIQLSVVGILPSLGGLIGSGLLIALVGQRLLRGKEAVLTLSEENTWQVPWDWETVWLVMVGGFFFVGQLALPGTIAIVRGLMQSATLQAAMILPPQLVDSGMAIAGFISLVIGESSRGRAITSSALYVLMSVSTLGVLYWAIKEHLPLSKDWFRINPAGRWPVWGVGGYLVALPLMLGVSLLNQQIWQGQGGNNPILQIVLEERDPVVLGLFLFTAAIAAPIFEEILFRGFLLPSLTRYMSTWTAIGLSSLIFATAHLSFSEVLPLAVLGAILGFVYTKSQNLMSSILLHSTWNSVTMIGLFLLGSGS
ncbi:MAG: type II CAAX endopeptidase family protein [Cyanobacteria bacterium J06560_6]